MKIDKIKLTWKDYPAAIGGSYGYIGKENIISIYTTDDNIFKVQLLDKRSWCGSPIILGEAKTLKGAKSLAQRKLDEEFKLITPEEISIIIGANLHENMIIKGRKKRDEIRKNMIKWKKVKDIYHGVDAKDGKNKFEITTVHMGDGVQANRVYTYDCYNLFAVLEDGSKLPIRNGMSYDSVSYAKNSAIQILENWKREIPKHKLSWENTLKYRKEQEEAKKRLEKLKDAKTNEVIIPLFNRTVTPKYVEIETNGGFTMHQYEKSKPKKIISKQQPKTKYKVSLEDVSDGKL